MKISGIIPAEMRASIKNSADIVRTVFEGQRVRRLTNFNCCPRPVLLIYGFGATRRIFSVMEKRLRKDGFDVFSINMGSIWDIARTGDIPWRAELVAKKVESLYRRYDLGPLTVIGHSEGGIIGRYFVQLLDGHRRVNTLITMASPHRGTPVAIAGAAAFGLVARNLFQLMPYSRVMRRLAKNPFPNSVNFYSLYSSDDWVCPPFSARAIDSTGNEIGTNVELSELGHNDFLIKKAPYQIIRRILFKIPAGAGSMEEQAALRQGL